jgi:radical SAM superfamily enzyme YgiQ (UPF0313 family)
MYLAAVLERNGITAHIRDYPASGRGWDDLERDIRDISPDLLLVSATVHTVARDFLAFGMARKYNPSVICVLKGFLPDHGKRALADCPSIDVVLGDEAEQALEELARGVSLQEIPGLSYRMDGRVQVNPPGSSPIDLDSLPFPARHLCDNGLYRMPDNGRKMGMILVSKGCPRSCAFCLVPLVNNKKVRLRSPDSILGELGECVHKYGITDFWFRADNFTADREWVIRLCDKIASSGLTIRWATNSRVDSLDSRMLAAMKRAGCFALGLGVESGSEETLNKVRKGITKEQAIDAVRLCRKNGIQTYLFFIIGFPWETARHIRETIDFARLLKGDVVNFSFATPFPGTELFELSVRSGLINSDTEYSSGNYGIPMMGTLHLSRRELVAMEKSAYRRIVFSPGYVMRSLGRIRSVNACACYLKAAFHLLKLCI